jgi:hypothetical protein
MSRLARTAFAVSVFGLVCVAGVSPASAQDASGRIIGVVTDPSGAVVPKVKITVTNAGTGVTNETTTGDDGNYQVPLLPVGSYRVSAEAAGFRKIVTDPQPLEINQALRIDIKLEVGAATETVMVEAHATGVETVSATVGSTVTSTAIQNAPLNGRNVMDLALLFPGVVPSNTSTPDSGSGLGSFSIAGGRPDSITVLLDGGVDNDLLSNTVVFQPDPDAVDEFRIVNNSYNAEYGRNGGGIISVATRSGTSTFHGSAYDYLRNGDFNANSFFNNQMGAADRPSPPEPVRRNSWRSGPAPAPIEPRIEAPVLLYHL